MGVLRPEALGRLVKRKQGRDRCEISLSMDDEEQSSAIAFATNAKSQVEVTQAPKKGLDLSPVYLPTRELLTLCPWFLPLYDNYHLEFEETWRDTVSLLGAPSVKGPREKRSLPCSSRWRRPWAARSPSIPRADASIWSFPADAWKCRWSRKACASSPCSPA
jgi:hypothetical protein